MGTRPAWPVSGCTPPALTVRQAPLRWHSRPEGPRQSRVAHPRPHQCVRTTAFRSPGAPTPR
eukprot:4266519-Prymnesium_polylepis.1